MCLAKELTIVEVEVRDCGEAAGCEDCEDGAFEMRLFAGCSGAVGEGCCCSGS